MAVPVSVTEDFKGGRTGSKNQRAEENYTRHFQVKFQPALFGVAVDDVLLAYGIPRLGSPYVTDYEINLRARCVSLSCEQDANAPQLWRVTAEYSTITEDLERFFPEGQAGGANEGESGSGGTGAGATNSFVPQAPIDRRVKISGGTNKIRKAIAQDITGAAIVNSAGDSFDPPPEDDENGVVLRFTRLEVAFPIDVIEGYKDAINSDQFLIAQPRQARMQAITFEEHVEQNLVFYSVTYEIEILTSGTWDLAILDQGFNEKDAEGNRVAMRDKEGNPYQEPQLLNNVGEKLPPGDEPGFLVFQTKQALPFAALNLV